MLLAARQHQQPAITHEQIEGWQQTIGARPEIELFARARKTRRHAVGSQVHRHTLATEHAHEAMLHRQCRMRRHALLGQVRRQRGGKQLQAGVAFRLRHPLHVLVALARAGGGATVVKSDAAGLGHDDCECGKVAAHQRQQLLLELAPGQHQMALAERKLVQDHDVLVADGADRQLRIGLEEGVEVRIARATRNRHLCGGILHRQRGHPAHDEAHAAVFHLGLLDLHRLQCPGRERSRAARIDHLHPIVRHVVSFWNGLSGKTERRL